MLLTCAVVAGWNAVCMVLLNGCMLTAECLQFVQWWVDTGQHVVVAL